MHCRKCRFIGEKSERSCERSPWQQHGVNSGVRLPNYYTRTKLEKLLPITSKDIYHFINYILYLLSFVETPRKFIIAELSIRKLGSSSVLIIRLFEFTRPFLYIKCRDCMLA